MTNSLQPSKRFENLFFVALILLFATPVLPQILKIASIAFFVVVCLSEAVKNKPKFKWSFFLFNSSLYIMYLLSVIYSQDMNYAFAKLEVAASLIVFPLSFAVVSKSLIDSVIEKIKYLFYAYIIAVLVVNIYLITSFLMDGNAWTQFIDYAPYVNKLENYPGIHSLYLSMHNAVAIIMVFYLLRTERFLRTGIPLFIIGFLLGIGLILLLKKGPVFALLVVATLLSFRYKLIRVWAFYGVFIISLGSLLVAFPSTVQRFNQLLKMEKVETTKNSAQIQKVVLNCAKEEMEEAGIFGFGLGDGNAQLIDCYGGVDQDLITSSYNSHNQYISLVLMVGFIGLFIFLAMLFFNVMNAVRSGVFITIAFILFYAIVMFSENILERQEGVVYFALLINLLYFLNKKNQQAVRRNPNQEELLKSITNE